MTDEDFEKAVVSWLASRGWLCQKLEPTTVAGIEAFVLPTPNEVMAKSEALADRLEALDRPESRFDEFWRLYPRKTGKEAARKIFEKLDLTSQNNATRGLKKHLEAEAFSPEKCYIKHPSTWLNQKVYLDDPEPRNWRKPQVGGTTPKRKALDDWLND